MAIVSESENGVMGAAAQFGIFWRFWVRFRRIVSLEDAAAIGIIGGADGPTAIFWHRDWLEFIAQLRGGLFTWRWFRLFSLPL